MSEIRPCFVALRVRDPEASVRFYRDALGVPLHADEEGTHHEYSWQEPYFHFALFPAEPEEPGLGFAVDDIDAAHERAVAAGATVVEPPRQQPWGRSARYRDPDGNQVELTDLRRPS